jgi:tRNA 5-methylaminomethyl-2-thiouridine biosynthesis bifunctional protein
MSLSYAKLNWQNDEPCSAQFDDIYYSSEHGLLETQHVFLVGNQLEERWKKLGQELFTIAETGFGTGLNFLASWDLWLKTAPQEALLHFVSFEKHPLSPADLHKALSKWPCLESVIKPFLAQYEISAPGFHRFIFEQGRVTLTLIIGDVQETISDLNATIDAWFFDGFAPANNPAMWSVSLFKEAKRLSHANTTFATFTSAGFIRRQMQELGFQVQKSAGFGKKREMMQGLIPGLRPAKTNFPKSAIIIGGGIAGSTVARSLAMRGITVTLIERHPKLASEASGNPQGILYPRLVGADTALNTLNLAGFFYTRNFIRQLDNPASFYHECGVLQLAFSTRELDRLQQISKKYPDIFQWIKKDFSEEVSGHLLEHDGAFCAQAGWINPPSFCQTLVEHPNINVMRETNALTIIRQSINWQVWTDGHLIAEAPVCIIASATDSLHFTQSAHCEMQAVRGQITYLPETQHTQTIKTVICSDGYIAPAFKGNHALGATFTVNDNDTDVREDDHQHNLAYLKTLAPHLSLNYDQSLKGRASIRAVCADYLPLAGELIDREQILKTLPRYNDHPATLPRLNGLLIHAGHGSKGLLYAPLCAEYIASHVMGAPYPIPNNLVSAINPNRFLLKKLGLKKLAQNIHLSREPALK